MTLGFGSCEPLPPGEHRVIPFGFYESMHCAEGIAPGCPPPGSGAGDGQWWYLVPSPTDASEATLVICSQLCMNFGPNGLACLQGLTAAKAASAASVPAARGHAAGP
jgi:hypothetical protein